jgi:hypothetical protein
VVGLMPIWAGLRICDFLHPNYTENSIFIADIAPYCREETLSSRCVLGNFELRWYRCEVLIRLYDGGIDMLGSNNYRHVIQSIQIRIFCSKQESNRPGKM